MIQMTEALITKIRNARMIINGSAANEKAGCTTYNTPNVPRKNTANHPILR